MSLPPSLLPVFDAFGHGSSSPSPESQAVLINSAMAQEAKYWVSLFDLGGDSLLVRSFRAGFGSLGRFFPSPNQRYQIPG